MGIMAGRRSRALDKLSKAQIERAEKQGVELENEVEGEKVEESKKKVSKKASKKAFKKG